MITLLELRIYGHPDSRDYFFHRVHDRVETDTGPETYIAREPLLETPPYLGEAFYYDDLLVKT